MRVLIAAGLAGASLAMLAACNKPAAGAGSASTSAAGQPPAASGPLTLDQVPHRRPGLWEQTVRVDDTPDNGPPTKLCVDETSEAKMSLIAQHTPGAHCDPPQFTRNIDGSLSFSGHCDMGKNGQSQSHGTITGDFQSGYTMAVDSNTSGSPLPAANGAFKMTIKARWTGPCAPGQKGGDMISPSGTKFNALEVGAAKSSPGGQ
jgi:hypothetical protein